MILLFDNDAACEEFSRRFWSRVDKSGGPEACWLWTGSKSHENGYGQISVNDTLWRAHRAAWSMRNGPIPSGLCVCHRCDVPACVNPDHLFLGSRADNNRDMTAKGRGIMPGPQRGSSNPFARLTDDAVRDIMGRLGRGDTKASIAAHHGVDPTTISKISKGMTWRHVTKSGGEKHAT